jgi:tRNA U34 2-thiouridine synthase MnmA/TrmU
MGERFYLQQKLGARNMSKAYTDKQVEVMIETYGQGNTDSERKEIMEKLAVTLGKTVGSIRAKLVAVGHYIKLSGKSTKDAGMNKEQYVSAIRIAIGARDNELQSLKNVTKVDLEVIMNQLRIINNMQEVKELG